MRARLSNFFEPLLHHQLRWPVNGLTSWLGKPSISLAAANATRDPHATSY